MSFARAYGGALVALAIIDILVINTVLKPLFEAEIPELMAEEFNLIAAAMFYFLYPAGAIWLAVRPAWAAGGLFAAIRDGAVFGCVAYATFDLTNMAILEGWSWTLVWADILWGTCLTATISAVAYLTSGRRPV